MSGCADEVWGGKDRIAANASDSERPSGVSFGVIAPVRADPGMCDKRHVAAIEADAEYEERRGLGALAGATFLELGVELSMPPKAPSDVDSPARLLVSRATVSKTFVIRSARSAGASDVETLPTSMH